MLFTMWLANEEFNLSVPIHWSQTGHGPGFPESQETELSNIGTWRQKGATHRIIFNPPVTDTSAQTRKVRIVAEADAVTLELTGETRWTHTFVEHQTQASLMHIGGLVSPIVIETRELDVSIEPSGGRIHLGFILHDGDEVFPIAFNLSFGARAAM